MELRLVWKILEETASAMEKGEGDWQAQVATAQKSMQRLFDFPPEEILLQAEQSHYPTKALIQWLLHEGQRIPGIGLVKLQGLCHCWNEKMGKERGAITFPPMG
ncbi:MAG: hypothetical protein ACLFVT_00815 [Syntrophobacteria bacterium]